MKRPNSLATAIAHLVGPGKIKVINSRLAYSGKDIAPLRLDPSKLREIYCYGPIGVTDDAMVVLFQNDVEVAWLSTTGQKFRGRLVRSDPTKTNLRLLQYQAFASPEWRLTWAKQLVLAKLASYVQVARHYQRHGVSEATDSRTALNNLNESTANSMSVDELRGFEGAASAFWFRLLPALLQSPWSFSGRNRRPPRDPVNALLSLGYTFLQTRVTARAEAAGLEIGLGGLHALRPGRPSLVCDLMEPLRVPVVDRWVLRLCNLQILKPEDFVSENGGVRLQREAFAKTLQDWEQSWLDSEHDQLLQSWIESLIQQVRQNEMAFTEEDEDFL